MIAIGFFFVALLFFIAIFAVHGEENKTVLEVISLIFMFVGILCLCPTVGASDGDFSCSVAIDEYSFVEWRDIVLPDNIKGDEFWTSEDITLTFRGQADWYYVMVNGQTVECNQTEPLQPAEDMVECLGFYAPVTEFTVDGNIYSAGSDGWVSFSVNRDEVWTWTVEVAGWVGQYQQSESEACHYVDTNN